MMAALSCVGDNTAPVIFGPTAAVLGEEEAAFFAAVQPFGFILFKRNCVNKDQLKRLVDDLRDCVGWHCPILIDQEGGRVARMKAPEWRDHPSAGHGGSLMQSDPVQGAAFIQNSLTELSTELVEMGIDVNCLPVLDVLRPGITDPAIGDRAYGDDPDLVIRCGEIAARTLLGLGVTPVMKHMPGHGGADLDTHKALPMVSVEEGDLRPFRHMAESGLPIWGMVAHILVRDVDEVTPSSLSERVIQEIIRGDIGFDGLLLSDDLSMGALDAFGGEAKTAKACLEAGLDIALHCNGSVDEMRGVMDSLPPLRQDSRRRINAWLKQRT